MQFENSYSLLRLRRGLLAKAGTAALLALALLALMAGSAQAGTPAYSLSISKSEGGSSPLATRTVAPDSAGNVYLANNGNGTVQKFNSSGKYLSKFALPTGCEAFSLDVDSSGNIWVACHGAMKVVKFSSTGTVLKEIGTYPFGKPLAVAADGAGNVWWMSGGDDGSGVAEKVDGTGTLKALIPTNHSYSIDVDPSGNVWIGYNGYEPGVREYKSDGELIRKWSPPGSIYGLGADASGNLWVGNNLEVKKYSPLGVQLDKFGSGKFSAMGQWDSVAVAPEGAIWVVNQAWTGSEVQKWVPTP
jgi:streptogramin lyase